MLSRLVVRWRSLVPRATLMTVSVWSSHRTQYSCCRVMMSLLPRMTSRLSPSKMVRLGDVADVGFCCLRGHDRRFVTVYGLTGN